MMGFRCDWAKRVEPETASAEVLLSISANCVAVGVQANIIKGNIDILDY